MWKKLVCAALFATACNAAPNGSNDAEPNTMLDDAEPEFFDESTPVGGKADSGQIYTEACRKAAVKAVGKLETQNGAVTTVKSIDAYNTPGFRQTLQLSVVRKLWGKTEKDIVEVDVSESQDDDCTVGAVRAMSRVPEAYLLEPDMYEAGATMVTPSAPCKYAAKKAVNRLLAVNGESAEVAASSDVGYLSKTAYILEVGLKFADKSFAPSPDEELPTFVVKAEPRGKSACLIWGIQDGRAYLSQDDYEDLDDSDDSDDSDGGSNAP